MDSHRTAIWRTVNALCLVASVAFLCFMIWSPNVNDTKTLYMVYDVTMTLVWCLEVVDRRQQLATSNMMFYGELSVAIIFLVDSSMTLLAWNLKSENIYLIFMDLILNSAAYTYAFRNSLNGQPDATDTVLLLHNTTPNR